MPASNRPVILCLSSTDWGFLRYRKQQLMERLSRHADVVYVNPPRAMKSREWPCRERTRQLSPSLWVHEPFVMPGMRISAIARQLTYRWLATRLAARIGHDAHQVPLVGRPAALDRRALEDDGEALRRDFAHASTIIV